MLILDEEKYIKLPFENIETSGEYVYTVSINLKEDTLWESMGYKKVVLGKL